jgi:hypothetical protein
MIAWSFICIESVLSGSQPNHFHDVVMQVSSLVAHPESCQREYRC